MRTSVSLSGHYLSAATVLHEKTYSLVRSHIDECVVAHEHVLTGEVQYK